MKVWIPSCRVVVASAPIAEKAQVIVMAQAISPLISDAGDYIFRIQPSASYYSRELTRIAIEKLGLKKIAILYINNEFGIALKDTVQEESKKIGATIITPESYTQGDQDFRSQLTKIKDAEPDALFIGGYQEQALIVRQAHEIGLNARILAGPPFENKSLIDDLGELAEGVIYPYHFIADTNRPETIIYINAYREKFGVETGGFAPLMYDAVYIIKNALALCDTNTQCIKGVLYNTTYKGVSGTITFDHNGDPRSAIVIKTVKDGEFIQFEL